MNWVGTGQRVLIRQGAIGQIRLAWLAFIAEVRSRQCAQPGDRYGAVLFIEKEGF